MKDCAGVGVIPFGCLEKHGRHLPLATDNLIAYGCCKKAAELEKAVVLPTSPFGLCSEVRHTPGTVGLKATTMMAILKDLCDEMARNGLKKIIIQNGHGGNTALCRFFMRTLLDERVGYSVYFMPMTWCDGQEIAFCRKFLGTDCLPECGHAGIQETSDILYLRPDLVRMDRVDVSETHRLERLKPLQDVRLETSVDWYADYPAQIMGDPTRSTPEMGEWMMTAWANNLARAIRLVKEDKMTPFLLDDYYSRSEMPRPYSS